MRNEVGGRWLWCAVGLICLAVAVGFLRSGPPPARSGAASPSDFSVVQSMSILKRLLVDATPHPVGSAANMQVRERLVAEFRQLGYETEVQEAFACSVDGLCATTHNVLARLAGAESGRAVMAVAHYDSVPSSPGAGDDGAAVASLLEVARLLKTVPPPPNTLLFLITDGEEAGLLGAEAFVAGHPALQDVEVVLNLEARGTSGPSVLFETGPRSADLVRLFGEVCPRPRSTSAHGAVFERMPNDTDFSVFKRVAKPGLNFAFFEDAAHYHTPLDSVENLDPASVQHRADCVLALMRVLVEAQLPLDESSDAVWFDFVGLGLVVWPAWSSLPLALLVLLGMGLGTSKQFRGGCLTGRALAWGLCFPVLSLLTAMLGGLAMSWLIRSGTGTPLEWAPHLPAGLALWGIAAVGVWGATALVVGRAGLHGLFAGVWLMASIHSIIAAALAPAVSFPLLAPAAAVAVSLTALGWSGVRAPLRAFVASLVGALAVVIVGLPAVLATQAALGLSMAPVVVAEVALLCIPIAPLLAGMPRAARWLPTWGAASIAALAALASMILPPDTEARPRPLNIVYHQDADTGSARWLVSSCAGEPPAAVRQAASLGPTPSNSFPFLPDLACAYAGPARSVAVEGPEATVLSRVSTSKGVRLQIRLRSTRGAPVVAVALPPRIEAPIASIDGQPIAAADQRGRFGGWRLFGSVTTPPEGIVLEIEFRDPGPRDMLLLDRSYALPGFAAPILQARPSDMVMRHGGDSWIVSRRVQLGAPSE